MIAVSDGEVLLGEAVKDGADSDAIGVLESVVCFDDDVGTTTKFNFRKDSDGALVTRTKAQIKVTSGAEKDTRNAAIALAALQDTFDAAKSALDDGGGDSCADCPP